MESSTASALNQRIAHLDIIRGFALFGIILVNMVAFQQTPFAHAMNLSVELGTLGEPIRWVLNLLVQGKFYVLFSLLFGFGFTLFIDRAQARGASARLVFLRRTLVLMLFGFAHFMLIWAGDILLLYGLSGLFLLFWSKASIRGLLQSAAIIAFIMYGLIWAGALASPNMPAEQLAAAQQNMQTMRDLVTQGAAYYQGESYQALVQWRWQEFLEFGLPGLGMFPMILINMLIGAAFARSGKLLTPATERPFFKRALVIGLVVGLPASAFFAMNPEALTPQGAMNSLNAAVMTLHHLGGLGLAVAYIALFALGVKAANGFFVSGLAAVGKLALTNYILQSVIFSTLFNGYGFGLYGQLALWQLVLMAVSCFALQLVVSRWYVQRFSYGPLEYLWRVLTYAGSKARALGAGETASERA